jgi:cyclic pyranopterin phosphate synthase
MPAEIFGKDFAFLPRAEILTFEEITRFARLAAGFGVAKVRLTGGEPLLRRDIERLVAMIATIPGVEIALTTNGAGLAAKAHALRDAGLSRVTVSLDSLDDAVFRHLNGVAMPLARVLDGISAAKVAGFQPVRLNAVVKRGVNDGGLLDLAAFGRENGHVVRFIEYMDVGTTNGWRLDDVVPAEQILEQIDAVYSLEPIDARYPGEVARRYRYRDGGGEIGVIASVSQPFCQGCTRARLTSDGRLITCLFAAAGSDVRTLLRATQDDAELSRLLTRVWGAREDRYSEERALLTEPADRVEMSYVGG